MPCTVMGLGLWLGCGYGFAIHTMTWWDIQSVYESERVCVCMRCDGGTGGRRGSVWWECVRGLKVEQARSDS